MDEIKKLNKEIDKKIRSQEFLEHDIDRARELEKTAKRWSCDFSAIKEKNEKTDISKIKNIFNEFQKSIELYKRSYIEEVAKNKKLIRENDLYKTQNTGIRECTIYSIREKLLEALDSIK